MSVCGNKIMTTNHHKFIRIAININSLFIDSQSTHVRAIKSFLMDDDDEN